MCVQTRPFSNYLKQAANEEDARGQFLQKTLQKILVGWFRSGQDVSLEY